jgi:Acyl-protein synthetase, LuxE
VTRLPSVDEIFSVGADSFDGLAERVLAFQREHNRVYREFSTAGLYLPIAAFKHGFNGTFDPCLAERIFRSSGTGGNDTGSGDTGISGGSGDTGSGSDTGNGSGDTGSGDTGGSRRAEHFVRDLTFYNRSLEDGFRGVFGSGPFTILAHLPDYASDSSLVYMAERVIATFGNPSSGFFLEDPAILHEAARLGGDRIVLIGAAFGLLDLLDAQPLQLPIDSLVVETGGMKTHRREIQRGDLHQRLARGFGVPRSQIWSEFGMCELLSQCYATGTERYRPPPWMRVSVRDPELPETEMPPGVPGVLAVIDLANAHSASAILTEDRAVQYNDGFEILGRLTGTDLRGCNYLLEAT